jgi:glucose/mannose-6-phosphate isomerase
MFDSHTIQRNDPQGMQKLYDMWPEIAMEYFEMTKDYIDFKNPNHVVFAGMGGSGLVNEVLISLYSKNQDQISKVNGFDIPEHLTSKDVFIATSVSGNTLETLTALDSARKIGCRIIAFSSGGKIEDYCKKYGLEHRMIPIFLSPRTSFTSFLYSMLRVLQPILPITEGDVKESLADLSRLKQKIFSLNLTETNPALNLADWFPKTPVIYYSKTLEASAVRLKNSFNENAKSHAIANELLEACHNDIVSWELPTTSKPIMVRAKNDDKRIVETWEIMKEFFEEKKMDYKEIFSNNGKILSQLVGLIYLFDYSTIYYAIKCGINPSPIVSTEFFKNKRKPFF